MPILQRSPSNVNFTTSIQDNAEPVQVITWEDLHLKAISSIDHLIAAIHGEERQLYSACVNEIIDALGAVMNGASFPGFCVDPNDPIFGAVFKQIMDLLGKLVVAVERTTKSPNSTPADLPRMSQCGQDLIADDAVCETDCKNILAALSEFVALARQAQSTPVQKLQPTFIDTPVSGGNWSGNGIFASPTLLMNSDHDSNRKFTDGEGPSSRNPSVSSSQFDHFWITMRSRQNSAASGTAATTVLDESLLDLSESQHATIVNVLRDLLRFLEQQPYSASSDEELVIEKAIKATELVRTYITLLETVDLTPLLKPLSPTVDDFKSSKQSVYDAVAGLLLAIQSLTSKNEPLAELNTRLEKAAAMVRELDRAVQSITFPLQFLVEEKAMREHKNSAKAESLDELCELPGTFDSSRHVDGNSRRNSFLDILIDEDGGSRPPDGSSSYPDFPATKSEIKLKQFFGNEGLPKAYAFTPSAPERRREDTPWYLKNDHEDELVYDSRGALKGGTVAALLERLTRHDFLDTSFNTTFLLTYRSFTNSRTLFDMLVQRFTIQPPEGFTQDQLDEWVERKQKPIRLRVFNILKIWVEQYWIDDDSETAEAEMSKDVLVSIEAFSKLLSQQQFPGSTALAKAVRQRQNGSDILGQRRQTQINVNLSAAPASILPKRGSRNAKISHFHALEIARQLTLIEFELFSRIKPSECLARTRNRRAGGAGGNGNGNANGEENIAALIHYSNQLTNYTADLILSYADVKKRANVIKHLINVADVSRIFTYNYLNESKYTNATTSNAGSCITSRQ